jgi:hypothetical protein
MHKVALRPLLKPSLDIHASLQQQTGGEISKALGPLLFLTETGLDRDRCGFLHDQLQASSTTQQFGDP